MKILQVNHFLSPLHGGGSIDVISNLSKHLAKRGHEVTLFTTDFELDREYIKSLDGVRVVPFHCIANIGLMLISPEMKKQLKKEIKDFDIIHIHSSRSYQNIIVRHYARKYKIPYVLQAHGSVLPIFQKERLKKIFDIFFGNRILRDASKVIAVSKSEVEQYKQMNIGEDKIVIVSNGIDIEAFKDLPTHGNFREKYDIKEDHIILFLGRIHKVKGTDFLIKSFSELTKEMNDVVLVLIGSDDGYREEGEKLIKTLNLGNRIKFIGFVDEKDKLSAYIDADVLVYPAIHEIFGLVPFEAVMCGTPVIVADDCGCGELVKEANCGYLVKYGDIEGLKEKLKKIIKNPKEGKEMVERGRKYIMENLTWDKVVRKVEEVYEIVNQ